MEAQIERKNTWKAEEDAILASTILEYIGNGGTQMKAFEEAAIKLGRSSSACGFRWNSTIRKQYEKDINAAKNGKTPRKQKTKVSLIEESNMESTNDKESVKQIQVSSIDPLSSIVHSVDFIRSKFDSMASTIRNLEASLEKKEKEINKLKRELELVKNPSEDLQALIQLLHKAKESGVMEQIG